jgi:hypothetical protein
MIEGCLGLSKSLDLRFGRKTTGAKMTDVPGHSRGIISPLAAGVKLLDIGLNASEHTARRARYLLSGRTRTAVL